MLQRSCIVKDFLVLCTGFANIFGTLNYTLALNPALNPLCFFD